MSYGNQPGHNPLGYPQQYYPPPPQKKSGGAGLWIVLGVVGGGLAIAVLACCGGLMYLGKPPVASAAASQPFSYADVPVPVFPERGAFTEFEPGVPWQQVSLGPQGGYYGSPGQGGTIYLYLPPGEHPPHSLPCVLICGAGSTLLSGMGLGDGDQPEHTPYVRAGIAVVAYELDGPDQSDGDPAEMQRAFRAFAASRAGLVNARNALEYVLTKVPEVNSKRIYAAGHSSAATHALLFAEHEPRLAGAIAYAPAVYLPERFDNQMGLRVLSLIVPGSVDFVTQSDPATHQASLKKPVMLFHAEDDGNCPVESTKRFAEALRQQGTDVTLTIVPTGDHYESMINEGIPAGIRWLQAH
jgi:dienelactone hydrolase